MSGDVYTGNILGAIGGSMVVFETVFRIFISVRVLSESAVDSGYLIILTEVHTPFQNSQSKRSPTLWSFPRKPWFYIGKRCIWVWKIYYDLFWKMRKKVMWPFEISNREGMCTYVLESMYVKGDPTFDPGKT